MTVNNTKFLNLKVLQLTVCQRIERMVMVFSIKQKLREKLQQTKNNYQLY